MYPNSWHINLNLKILIIVLISLIALLDNYDRAVGRSEKITEFERNETWSFIEEISKTSPIKEVHKFLAHEGLASRNMVSVKNYSQSYPSFAWTSVWLHAPTDLYIETG